MKRKTTHHTYLHESGLKVKIKKSVISVDQTTAAGDTLQVPVETEYFTAAGQECHVKGDESWPDIIYVMTQDGTVKLERA